MTPTLDLGYESSRGELSGRFGGAGDLAWLKIIEV